MMSCATSSLSEYMFPFKAGGNSLELVLEGRCSNETANALVKELGRASDVTVSSLFVHKSFLRCTSETQQVAIFGCLPDLEELSLSSVTISANALVALLARATRLRKIHLDRVCIHCSSSDEVEATDKFCEVLSELPVLEEFHLSLGSTAPIQEREQRATLFVGGETDNLEPLVQALSFVKTLQCVYMGSDRCINRTVVNPNTLASLSTSVEDITLRNIGLGPLHCSCFYSRSLESLSLIKAGLGDEGALLLAQLIENTLSSLEKLYLPGNGITDLGGVAIAQALDAKGSDLEVLDLHGNKMTTASGLVLSKWLKTSSCGLTFLDLSGNKLGDDVGVSLASALATNTRLQQLMLFGCGLGDQTCKAIASSLGLNNSIKKINLYENERIGEEGILALFVCLEYHNSILDSLEISSSRNKELVKKLNFILSLNRDFKREELLQTISDRKFVEHGLVRAAKQADPSALFYLLRNRASLFSPPPVERPKRSAKIVVNPAIRIVRRNRPVKATFKTFCNPQA